LFFKVPTIGNKTGECLPQKAEFPSQIYSISELFSKETNSAPLWFIVAIKLEFESVVIKVILNLRLFVLICKYISLILF